MVDGIHHCSANDPKHILADQFHVILLRMVEVSKEPDPRFEVDDIYHGNSGDGIDKQVIIGDTRLIPTDEDM